MKRFISLFIAIVLLFSACLMPSAFAEKKTEFSFRYGVTWWMTPEEVEYSELSEDFEEHEIVEGY